MKKKSILFLSLFLICCIFFSGCHWDGLVFLSSSSSSQDNSSGSSEESSSSEAIDSEEESSSTMEENSSSIDEPDESSSKNSGSSKASVSSKTSPSSFGKRNLLCLQAGASFFRRTSAKSSESYYPRGLQLHANRADTGK